MQVGLNLKSWFGCSNTAKDEPSKDTTVAPDVVKDALEETTKTENNGICNKAWNIITMPFNAMASLCTFVASKVQQFVSFLWSFVSSSKTEESSKEDTDVKDTTTTTETKAEDTKEAKTDTETKAEDTKEAKTDTETKAEDTKEAKTDTETKAEDTKEAKTDTETKAEDTKDDETVVTETTTTVVEEPEADKTPGKVVADETVVDFAAFKVQHMESLKEALKAKGVDPDAAESVQILAKAAKGLHDRFKEGGKIMPRAFTHAIEEAMKPAEDVA